MKKFLVFLTVVLCCNIVYSQTSLGSSTLKLDSMNRISIKPIQFSILDSAQAVSMKFVSIYDDFKTTAQFYIIFFDANNKKVIEKNFTITGNDYTSWDKSLSYIAQLFCKKYGISLL